MLKQELQQSSVMEMKKLGELGYERSAKKCKEKFENVNKYYKRTKEGKAGRQDGKTYRFFTQLEALSAINYTTTTAAVNCNNHTAASSSSKLTPASPLSTTIINMQLTSNPNPSNTPHHLNSSLQEQQLLQQSNVTDLVTNYSAPHASSTEHGSHGFVQSSAVGGPPARDLQLPANVDLTSPFDRSHAAAATATALCSSSRSSSSDKDEDDGEENDSDGNDNVLDEDDTAEEHGYLKPPPPSDTLQEPSHAQLPSTEISKKRKRKSSSFSMTAFFEGLLKKVIDKQEQMQHKFLQAMEKRESDRMIREEAWRRQEMARLSKEHELRDQERNSASAREAAIIAFLHKVTGQTIELPTMGMSTTSLSIPAQPVATIIPIAAQPVQSAPPLLEDNMSHQYEDHDASDPSSKRWLKPEVLHLIELHSGLQIKFTETGPKGPLWEEIANGMAKRGYPNRTAKRCKEKWENINKYFKRAKESNKKRPENAKTCPYFHELDALYRRGLGSFNQNQLPAYKPGAEHASQDENSNALQSLMSNKEGGFDRAISSHMQPAACMLSASTATAVTDASNASATDANNNTSIDVGDVLMKSVVTNYGALQRLGSLQLSMADAYCGLTAASASDHPPRSGFSAELGLSIQQQSSTMDIYQHKPVTQAEPGKLPSNAGGGHAEDVAAMQSQFQPDYLKESKPSLAPLPSTSSFMANMLQKMSSNNTNSNPQDQ